MVEFILLIIVVAAAWFYMQSRRQKTEEVAPDAPVVDNAVELVEDDAPVVDDIPDTPVTTARDMSKSGATTDLMARLYTQTANGIPQDSVLRRHYLQNVMAGKPEVIAEFPEDSTLRRHYLQNKSVQDAPQEIVDTIAIETEAVVVAELAATEVEAANPMPEDAVLKRHFLQQVVAEVEAMLPERPTDATLKRHYDAQLFSLVMAKLQA